MNVVKYRQTLIDDEYESSSIASLKELGRISGNLDLNHTIGIPIYINCGPHCIKILKNITGIRDDGMKIK